MRMLVCAAAILVGVYLAQTYDLPSVSACVQRGCKVIKNWESNNRK